MRSTSIRASLLCLGLVGVLSASTPATAATDLPAAPSVFDAADDAASYHINTQHTGNQPSGPTAPLGRKWVLPLQGVLSYPLIAQGMTFVTATVASMDPLNSKGYRPGNWLYAVDLASGQKVWERQLDTDNSQKPTIAYEQGRIFAQWAYGWSTYDLAAFDARTGTELWHITDSAEDSGSFMGPIVARDGALYVPRYGGFFFLAAHSTSTGAILWRQQRNAGAIAVTNEGVYSGAGCGARKVLPFNGLTIWEGSEPDCYGWNGPPPSVYGTRVYGNASGGSGIVRSAITGTVLGRTGISSDLPLAFDGLTGYAVANVFGQPGLERQLVAFDILTNRIKWSFGKDACSNPVVAGGSMYVLECDGVVNALDKITGALQWSDDSGDEIRLYGGSSPEPYAGIAAGEQTLVVPAGDTLVGYQGAGGTNTDDDIPPRMSISGSTVAEYKPSCTLTVSLSSASRRTINVDYHTVTGSAKAGQDFVARQRMLSFAPGATTKRIAIPLLNNGSHEESEKFTVRLSFVQPSGAASIVKTTGTCTITDND